MRTVIICLMIISSLILGTGYPSTILTAAVCAEDEWRAEFDDICGLTTDSMTLSKDELKGLIDRCDRLKPRIEKLDESAAKVYLTRLRRCKELLVYVLEFKSQ